MRAGRIANVKLFLSCVSDEFDDDRDELRRKLTRPNVEIKIQEDFQNLGGDTLVMLEEYVASCDVVVHFIGDMSGSVPKATSVDDLLKRRPELAARLAEKAWIARHSGASPTRNGRHGSRSASTETARSGTSSSSRQRLA